MIFKITSGECFFRLLMGSFFAYAFACGLSKEVMGSDDGHKISEERPSSKATVLSSNLKKEAVSSEYSVVLLLQLLRWQIEHQPWNVSQGLVERIVSAPSADPETIGAALLIAARYTSKLGKHGESIVFYERWRQLQIDEKLLPEVLVELGREYREIGAFRSALDSFYTAMRVTRQVESRLTSSIQMAQWEVAETSYRLHDWERARRLFELFADSNKEGDLLTQSAFYRMGDCSRMLGDAVQTVVDYQRSLAHNSEHPFAPEARMGLLEVFLDQEKYPLAFKTLDELVASLEPMNSSDVIYWKRRSGELLFRHMFQQSSKDVALQILNSLEKLDPAPSWQEQLAYWKGLVYLKKTDWEKARESFLKKWTNEKTSTAKAEPKSLESKAENSSGKYADLCQWVLAYKRKVDDLRLLQPE